METAPSNNEASSGTSALDDGLGAITVSDVVAAIVAVDTEAARRGEMFPQTSDEQRADQRAVARVIGMIQWYDQNTGCANIAGWPKTANVRSQATDAALLRQVACTDGLGVAVPSAPTFEQGDKA